MTPKVDKLVEKQVRDSCMDLVSRYINETHGSLGNFNVDNLDSLLSEDFLLNLEDRDVNKEELLILFTEWSKIVENTSNVIIHAICKNENFNTVLAHWETK